MRTSLIKNTILTAKTALVVICLGVGQAWSSELSPAGYLHKLSNSIRGYSPTAQEYSDLAEAAKINKEADFLKQKIQGYLKSPEHAENLNYRLEELFQFRVSPIKPDWYLSRSQQEFFFPEEALNQNATVELFKSLAKENKSWDTLLTGKQYKTYSYDWGFLGAATILPKTNIGTVGQLTSPTDLTPVDVTFDDSDPRIAGALTSQRFFDRYATTALNKNRRRAAAIFRIFMCDPMVAAIPATHDKLNKYENIIFPETGPGGMSETAIKNMVADSDKRHGQQADCLACHYKLDPLGQGFRTSALALNAQPSASSLVFKNTKGETISRPGRGLGDVAKAITEQPEYVNCQVQHFWNWFIGVDIPLTEARKTELAQEFEKAGRRTNDFIAHLVSRPEFKQKSVVDPFLLVIQNVKSIFQRCDSCHNGKESTEYGTIPTFAKWPIGGTSASMSDWTKYIANSLDLDHDGDKRKMPPSPDGFRPSSTELQNIKQWIELGAPDESGKKWIP